jgi:uncharacterized peroxidase-related enzyme
MPWIDTVPPERAYGALADLYRAIAGARGGVAEVHQVQSLNPKAMAAHLELYKAVVFQRSSLSRRQRERIGVVVSAANACAYCVAHHGQALRGLGEDPVVADALERGDMGAAPLDAADRALLDAALTIGLLLLRQPVGPRAGRAARSGLRAHVRAGRGAERLSSA